MHEMSEKFNWKIETEKKKRRKMQLERSNVESHGRQPNWKELQSQTVILPPLVRFGLKSFVHTPMTPTAAHLFHLPHRTAQE